MNDDDDERSTVLRYRFDPTREGSVHYRAQVLEGEDAGSELELELETGARVLVGQGSGCEVRLRDRSVSRRHAALELRDDGLLLTDERSTNGTWVNGVRVQAAFVQDGDRIKLGSVVLQLTSGEHRVKAMSREMSFGGLVGASTEIRRLHPLFHRLATSDVAVIIEGETGTGKEALAESIHAKGPRAAGPFVVFDCTAVPANLLESELFGHERGAFTGAIAARKGVFEQAEGGTLLIDEIGDLALDLQPKLLRVLERGELRRLGGERTLKPDVRVLAATRRDLDQEVAKGRFRDDLYHRLSVVRVELPPLRRRRGDIALLATHFCTQLGGDARALDVELLKRWEDSPWPGNVRELRNAVARHLAIGDVFAPPPSSATTVAPAADLYTAILEDHPSWPRARDRVVDEFRQRYVADALQRNGGNVAQAAKSSGIALRYFQALRARDAPR